MANNNDQNPYVDVDPEISGEELENSGISDNNFNAPMPKVGGAVGNFAKGFGDAHAAGANSNPSSDIARGVRKQPSNKAPSNNLEKESNLNYNDFIKEKIFKPLDMVNSHSKYNSDIVHSYDNFFGFPVKFGGIESEIGDGFYVPAGFISSSIDDMEKYIRFYFYSCTNNDINPMTPKTTSTKQIVDIIRLINKYPKIWRFLYPEN